MSLDVTKLKKARTIGGGSVQAQCPACFELGSDKTGNHLRIWPDGRYGCSVFIQDRAHRKRIWELVGGAEPIARVYTPARIDKPSLNCTALVREWALFTNLAMVTVLAESLGVAPLALVSLGVVWTGTAWATPMKDEYKNVVGIQLRHTNGFKQTMTGSRVGFFIPETQGDRRAFICEGASDTAAGLSMGLWACGRYNCSQGGDRLGVGLRGMGFQEAVIVADADEPGIRGAEKLGAELRMRSCVYVPPCKDLREGLALGVTKEMIDSTIKSLRWKNP